MQLGISAEPVEALTIARERAAGDPQWAGLDLLSLGFFAADEVPRDLPHALREAELAVTIHPIELNLPQQMSDRVVANLDRWVDALDPVWLEQDAAIWLVDQTTYLGAQIVTPPLSRDSAARIAASVLTLGERWERPFYVENPPFFTSGGGDLTSFGWVAALIAEGAEITLDIGHIIGAQINLREQVGVPSASWAGWPAVRSLHLSGQRVLGTRRGLIWLDKHDSVFTDSQVTYATSVVERATNARALTLEMEGAPSDVVGTNISIAQNICRSGAREPSHV